LISVCLAAKSDYPDYAAGASKSDLGFSALVGASNRDFGISSFGLVVSGAAPNREGLASDELSLFWAGASKRDAAGLSFGASNRDG